MAKIINISDKLSTEKPCITVGDKTYEVNDSLKTVMKFEETYGDGDIQSMIECMAVALGEQAYNEIGFDNMSFSNIKVWFLAVMAALQDLPYDEVEARFRKFGAEADN